MCLNCGCQIVGDDMGDPKNLTLRTLALAALAGNNGDAEDTLQKVKESLETITPEDLAAEIEKVRAEGQDNNSNQEDSGEESAGEMNNSDDESSEMEENSEENKTA